MTSMTIPPSPLEASPAELRAYVLAQVERLETAVAPIRHAQVDVDDPDPAARRELLEIRVATLEQRLALGGR